jgi:hydroxymethylglutaryl-CoA reductase
MALHARQIAIAAGASGRQVEAVVERLLADNQITLSRAESVLKEL